MTVRLGLLAAFLVAATVCADATAAVQYWDLPTGSHIAYVRMAPATQKTAGNLIYLHGGPGADMVASALEHPDMFAGFARAGFDVIVYDQIGSGYSARLADPRQYTVARHVADLEAIRQRIGAAHPAFIGESWGSTLLANYMAAHPGVAWKAIFLSPGPLDPSEDGVPSAPEVHDELWAWLQRDRPNMAARHANLETLARTSILEAYRSAPDAEMDPVLDDFVNTTVRDMTVFDRRHAGAFHIRGMGYWSYLMTNFDLRAHSAHPQNRLRFDRTPVLVLRGEADYVPADEAHKYARTFPNARFLRIAKAGHVMWLEQPAVICKAMEAFLLERSS